nr:MAG TPA: hypothetical protein [Caudoviricetes sp.]
MARGFFVFFYSINISKKRKNTKKFRFCKENLRF